MQRVILLLLLLAGCGGGEDPYVPPPPPPENHGYGWHYDVQGPRGLRLRHSGLALSDPRAYEQTFDEVQLCTGLNAPMPFVIITPLGGLDHLGANGYYYPSPSLIALEANATMFFRHEAIHYLLDVGTGDLDPGHTHELWKRCA